MTQPGFDDEPRQPSEPPSSSLLGTSTSHDPHDQPGTPHQLTLSEQPASPSPDAEEGETERPENESSENRSSETLTDASASSPGSASPLTTSPSDPVVGRNLSGGGVRPWFGVLGGAVGLFCVVSLVMTVLYLRTDSDLDNTRHQLEVSQGEVSTLTQELEATRQEVADLQGQLAESEATNANLTQERDIIATCLDLLIEMLEAQSTGDQRLVGELVQRLEQPCREADYYLT